MPSPIWQLSDGHGNRTVVAQEIVELLLLVGAEKTAPCKRLFSTTCQSKKSHAKAPHISTRRRKIRSFVQAPIHGQHFRCHKIWRPGNLLGKLGFIASDAFCQTQIIYFYTRTFIVERREQDVLR